MIKLHKRIGRIVTLTVDDLLNHGISFSCTHKEMIQTITDELMGIELIGDYATAEISLMALQKLQSLHIINSDLVRGMLSPDTNMRVYLQDMANDLDSLFTHMDEGEPRYQEKIIAVIHKHIMEGFDGESVEELLSDMEVAR